MHAPKAAMGHGRRYCVRRIERLRPSLWRSSRLQSRSDF